MSPYLDNCSFTSRVFDAGQELGWGDLLWSGYLPSGTSVVFETRTGYSARLQISVIGQTGKRSTARSQIRITVMRNTG